MARAKKTNFEMALANSATTYWQFFNRLLELAVTSFQWENVPDGINARFLEMTLFSDGKALLFRDEEMDKFLALQFTTAGQLNVYREPIRRRAYAVTGYQRTLDESNSVIMYNNYTRTNSFVTVLEYAKRIYKLDRIIDVNSNAQKTPYVIQCSDTQRLTFKNLFAQVDENQPVVFADKSVDLSGITVLRTDAPYISDRIYELKTRYWNEVLTYLGISNVTYQKRERLITDEVARQMGGVLANRFCRLQPRQEAADAFNKMFGTDIKVRFRDGAEKSEDDLIGQAIDATEVSINE